MTDSAKLALGLLEAEVSKLLDKNRRLSDEIRFIKVSQTHRFDTDRVLWRLMGVDDPDKLTEEDLRAELGRIETEIEIRSRELRMPDTLDIANAAGFSGPANELAPHIRRLRESHDVLSKAKAEIESAIESLRKREAIFGQDPSSSQGIAALEWALDVINNRPK